MTAIHRLEGASRTIEPFPAALSTHGLILERAETAILQINVGLKCNQVCRHCHLDAGPHRSEQMDRVTQDEVAAFAERGRFETIDLTGGAPEMHPDLIEMMQRLSALTKRLMIRSNLTAMEADDPGRFVEAFRSCGAEVVASFPSLHPGQTESQRGKHLFETMIRALRRLNASGYGQNGTGLKLHLVSNPTGAFLPPSQKAAEQRFRAQLMKKWGIVFNEFFTFANVPLGRFRQWLFDSGNFDTYMDRLTAGFNPCTVEGLMCRTLVLVDWGGYLYDCDFNLASGLPMAGRKVHVSDMEGPPLPGTPIAVGDHCYTCAAGSGFT